MMASTVEMMDVRWAVAPPSSPTRNNTRTSESGSAHPPPRRLQLPLQIDHTILSCCPPSIYSPPSSSSHSVWDVLAGSLKSAIILARHVPHTFDQRDAAGRAPWLLQVTSLQAAHVILAH